MATVVVNPADAAEATSVVAETPADTATEHVVTGLAGANTTVKADDLPSDNVLVLKGNSDCEVELVGITTTRIRCIDCSNCTIKVPLGCTITSGTVEIHGSKGVQLKSTMAIKLVEVSGSSGVGVSFNNPEQLGEIKHTGATQLSVGFLNSKEYNTEITPAMLEQASPGADAATTLFVTRLYDSEIITEDSLKRDEAERVKAEKAKPKMDPERKAMIQRAKKMLGDKKPEGIDHVVTGHKGETLKITNADLPAKPVLMLEDNTDCEIDVSDCSLIKMLVKGCNGCTITLPATCGILTSTIEIWGCKGVSLDSAIEIGTIQVDMCADVKIKFPSAKELGQVVVAGVHTMDLTFETTPEHNKSLTLEVLQEIAPGLTADDDTTQFTTRFVEGSVLTEEIIRLANDFPTTAREKAKHDKDINAKDSALREMAESMLANVGDKLSPEEKARVQGAVDKSTTKKSADTDVGPEARCEYKKKQGNEAFKAKDYQQAAVFYTAAIDIKGDIPAIWANRAMCWLKLANADQALADADHCITLDPKYTKAHFRRSVALMELKRYVDALKTLRTVLDLDPKNAAAKASMMLAEKKLREQNR